MVCMKAESALLSLRRVEFSVVGVVLVNDIEIGVLETPDNERSEEWAATEAEANGPL